MIHKRIRFATLLATTTIICGVGAPAIAQLENQTTIADPGRAAKQLQEDMFIPQVAPEVNIKHMELQGAPPGAEKIKFKFGGLRIEGATAYKDADLASLYKDKIGQEISLADIYTIANNMTIKYRNDGYILTQVVVPPQTIENGVAHVEVVEGFIDKIIVQPQGNEGPQAVAMMRSYANQIRTGGPANVKALERELLLINDLPGVKARSILSPSKTTKGAADLLIITERKPYDAMISVDNYGSRYLGPWQLGAAGTLNSVIGMNDAISAQVVTTPEFDEGNELVYGAASYEMPVGPWGTKVAVLGSITDTDPGFDLEQFDVHGRSDLLEIKATHPFIRARSTNLYGRVMLDLRNVYSENTIEDPRRDHIREVRAGLRYEFLDRLLGVGFNSIDLLVSHGIGILHGSDKGDADMTRPLADPQATKAELEVQRLQRITDDLNLLVLGRGQMANKAVLSSEEFGVGGFNLGRGYDPSEIVGDDGIAGRLELQWKNPGNFQNKIPAYLEKYQVYGFYDIGAVWNDDASTQDGKDDSLASVGAGVRLNFVSGVAGGLGVAFPLTRDVQTRDDRSPKLYFNLNKTF